MKKYLGLSVMVAVFLSIFSSVINNPQLAFADTSCTTQHTVVSDTSTTFVNSTENTSGNAAAAWNGSSLWTTIPGATWIWSSELVEHPDQTENVTFTKTFSISDQIATSSLSIAADDTYDVQLNGHEIGANTGYSTYASVQTYDITSALIQGENTLTIEVTNRAYYLPDQATAYSNPAGLLFSITLATPTECPTLSPSPTPSTTPAPSSGGSSGAAPQTAGGGFETNQPASPTNSPVISPIQTQSAVVQAPHYSYVSKPIAYSYGHIAPNTTPVTSPKITSATTSTTVSSSTDLLSNASTSNNLAAAASSATFTGSLYFYFLLALILLAIIYIIWRIAR